MMERVERMKRRKIYVSLILAVMLLCSSVFIFLGCKKQGNITLYKVVDSGAWIGSPNFQQTFWLDNERVLFISNKALSPSADPQFITIWNTKTGKVDFSHQSTAIICVQDGQVFFATKDDATGKRSHYRGPLDNPQEYPAPGPNMWIDDRFDCDWAPKPNRANVPYKIKLKDDNYLEITEESNIADPARESRYYERQGRPPTPLPVHADIAVAHYSIRFNQLRNAYLISPGGYRPGDPYHHLMWWLSRDGHLTQVPFPKKIILPVQGGFEGGVQPLREGFLVLYNGGGTRSMTNTGARGLYLIKGDDMEKVLLGEIHGVSISPDGCRAAFSHARNTKEDLSLTKPYRTVKTINFCEGGGKL